MDVVTVHDHVAQVDADPKIEAAIGVHVGVPLRHAPLDLDSALHSLDDATELYQQAVAHHLDDAPVVLGYLGVD